MIISEFEQVIGYEFKDKSLLERALTHSSYANEKNLKYDNERLEFLGDSVLGFVTAEYLFSEFKARPEGELTKLRAATVCEKSLFKFAEKISLGKYIFMGKGEEHSGGRNRPSIVSDAFEEFEDSPVERIYDILCRKFDGVDLKDFKQNSLPARKNFYKLPPSVLQ